MEQDQSWTEDEFITFSLIFMANADTSIGKTEIDHIKSKFSSETFDKMYTVFKDAPDYTRIQYIVKHKELHLNDESKMSAFIKKMETLILADNKTDVMETFSLNSLVRILK